MSLVLSIALLLISAAPITANAFDSIDMDDNAELITPSANAIYSVWGSEAPASLCQELTALNVTITADTLIEILPMTSGSGTALIVSNVDGTSVIKDVIFGIDNGGQIAAIQPIYDDSPVELLASGWIPGNDWTLVRASAVYNLVYMEGDI